MTLDNSDSPAQTTHLDLPDADIVLYENCLEQKLQTKWLNTLYQTIAWQQPRIKMFGKSLLIPRLQAWYGDPNANYRYSGMTLSAMPWTSELDSLRQWVETLSKCQFNSVLANGYRDGNDSMGWHADDEPELGEQPVIASLTLGACRRFLLRHKQSKQRCSISLPSGSVLVMRGHTQQYWQHSLPKTKRACELRLNFTFRYVIPGYR